jgi:hypothetical protein
VVKSRETFTHLEKTATSFFPPNPSRAARAPSPQHVGILLFSRLSHTYIHIYPYLLVYTRNIPPPPSPPQAETYAATCAPLIERCLLGYNATVFAYGQTSTGKTYTMGTHPPSGPEDPGRGVIPRAIEDVFSRADADADADALLVRVSFLEIYNETLRDLLNPDADPRSLAIREDGAGAIAVAGVREVVCRSAAEALGCLERGSIARSTAGTLMNAAASRSHSVFTMMIERRVSSTGSDDDGGDGHEDDGADGEAYVHSKFHLVDLAGSERAKRTGATGQRFAESKSINAGLLALGNVIRALTDPRRAHGSEEHPARPSVHVPYRQSKLTRLLQDSLGGTAHTVMIACVSPTEESFEETMCTLKYAQRAAHIRNKPVVNRDARSVELAEMQHEIEALQLELLKLRKTDGNDSDGEEGGAAGSRNGAGARAAAPRAGQRGGARGTATATALPDAEYGIEDLVKDDITARLIEQMRQGVWCRCSTVFFFFFFFFFFLFFNFKFFFYIF